MGRDVVLDLVGGPGKPPVAGLSFQAPPHGPDALVADVVVVDDEEVAVEEGVELDGLSAAVLRYLEPADVQEVVSVVLVVGHADCLLTVLPGTELEVLLLLVILAALVPVAVPVAVAAVATAARPLEEVRGRLV